MAKPLCQSYGADLYLPSGEITDSQLWLMAKTGAEDGRPMIVVVLADFDPSGNQMAVSIGRKLQAFRDLLYPDLELEVIPICLTEEQVRKLDLPSTPLKETEKRADRWREAHGGLEQTEIDALATLRPEVLRRIIRDAFDRYFDYSLDRVPRIREDWESKAQAALDEAIDAEVIASLHAEAETKLGTIREEVERINAQLRASAEEIDVALPQIPELPETGAGRGRLASPHLDRLGMGREQPGADRAQAIRQRRGRRMTAPVPDLDQARRFLTLLDEEAPAFCFQTATDAEPKPYPDHLARVINLPPDNLKALAIRNGNGAAVWVMINEGDGEGAEGRERHTRACRVRRPRRRAAAAGHGVRARAAFRGREQPGQVPYLLARGGPAAQSVRGRAAPDRHNVRRRPRHRPVPGDEIAGLHSRQDPSAPFMVRIVHQAERLPYPAADILRVFPPLEREQGKENGAGEAIDLPHQPPEPLSHARLAALKESHGHLFDLDRYGGHHSQRDLALAGVAARLGWPIADAWALIIRLREGLAGKEAHKAYRRDYIASTLALAYRDVEPEHDQQSAERIERLIEQAAADPGAAFESGSIDFLAALRARDPAAYERARARMKKAKVRVGVLDQEVERRKPEPGDRRQGQGARIARARAMARAGRGCRAYR